MKCRTSNQIHNFLYTFQLPHIVQKCEFESKFDCTDNILLYTWIGTSTFMLSTHKSTEFFHIFTACGLYGNFLRFHCGQKFSFINTKTHLTWYIRSGWASYLSFRRHAENPISMEKANTYHTHTHNIHFMFLKIIWFMNLHAVFFLSWIVVNAKLIFVHNTTISVHLED